MKASERRLIAILIVLAAVCGGAILSQSLLRRQRDLDNRQHALDLQQMEASAMLAEASLWKARLDWLKTNQPSMTSENQASQALLDEMLATAAAHQLTVQKKQLHEATPASSYHEIGVTLTVLGDLPDVFRWMHEVLSPESFRLASQFKILPDATDKTKVLVTARINRRYTPVIAAADTSTEGGAP